jgi:sec-independent protein translocase protein TatC
MNKRMFDELKNFMTTITDWVVLLIVFTVFFFTCNVETVTLFNKVTVLPVPAEVSFAADFFTLLISGTAPEGLPIVATSPTTAFVIQVKLALLLAIFFTFPVFLLRLIAFLHPALHKREQRFIYLSLVPLTVLFFGGVYFSYVFIVPTTLEVLYAYTAPIGATQLLGVAEFVGVVMALLLATGLAFTVPVLMSFLTLLGLVSSRFWFENARYAIVFFLVISAIITPDGSGVSMVLLSLPVSTLYGVGIFACMQIDRVAKKESDVSRTRFSN